MDLDSSYVQRPEDEAFPPLPPPHSPGQGGGEDREPFGNEEDDDEGNVSKLDEVPAAKRKGVKRPQPKLDSQRLISERGLPALRTMFDHVHFKGKGHEAADLKLLMQKMENWAHRLFPKLQFEDFIDKVEKLGNKKEVQTCLKRIRLDMPLTHEDFNEGEEAAAPLPLFEDPDPFSGGSFSHEVQRHAHYTPAPAAPSPAAPPSLSEEQQRRMELNRQRALERRLARHRQQEADSAHSQAVDTSADESASVSSANVLNKSKVDEEVTERLDLEPKGSSTPPPSLTPPTEPPSLTPPTDPPSLTPPTQPPSQTPPTDPPSLTPPTDPPSLTPPTDPPSLTPPTDPPSLPPPTDPPSLTPPTDQPSRTPPTDPPSLTPPTDPEASAESSQREDETSQQPIIVLRPM
ncbi:TIMELESS-interacting protein [Limanda limanda]|uniref:TIMELESS-interacting protein n=1 Tax=Limanda limanda TaxID=27771 RepID=UPI0029C87BE1|nr:TIMELESS-interacting protein [Limanda limanda]